jgi:hypothetical protein
MKPLAVATKNPARSDRSIVREPGHATAGPGAGAVPVRPAGPARDALCGFHVVDRPNEPGSNHLLINARDLRGVLCRAKSRMTRSDEAADHLRVIRQLMERSTIYRAISAPSALAGGLAAMALSWWQETHAFSSKSFHASWLALFAVLAGFNALLLWREARRRGDAFISAGMRLALRALAPPLFAGFIFGLNAIVDHTPSMCALSWCVFYGLALLATGGFAPVSITRLGAAFVFGGLALLVIFRLSLVPHLSPPLIMGLTFGGLHVVYAVCVILTGRRIQP